MSSPNHLQNAFQNSLQRPEDPGGHVGSIGPASADPIRQGRQGRERPLSDWEWVERTFASVVLLIAGALFVGYSTSYRWPIWCFILGFMAAGNGAIFVPVALLSWRDDHRARRQRLRRQRGDGAE